MDQQPTSIFSLSRDLTDLSLQDPRVSPSPSAASSTRRSSHSIPRKSLPDLRASAPLVVPQDLNTRASMHSMYTAPTPILEEQNEAQYPSPLIKALPERPDSLDGSRPSTRAGRSEARAGGIASHSREASRIGSRSGSPAMFRPLTPTQEGKIKKRRLSWLPGKSGEELPGGQDVARGAQAWVITPQEKLPYDLAPLLRFQVVPELWDETGDTFVYLHNRPPGFGVSFRVDSAVLASSSRLVRAAHGATHLGNGHSRQSSAHYRNSTDQQRSFAERAQGLTVDLPVSPPTSWHGSNRSTSTGGLSARDYFDEPLRKKDIHLCLPQPLQADFTNIPPHITANDVETLITVRNLFAFLTGRSLVATPRRPSMFAIFMHVAEILHRYEFTNFDGSSMGEESTACFATYLEDFRLADVRASREKTIEAIILGERMKSWDLYNEGFVHAVGKYNDISALKSPKLREVSEVTRKRLERSHIFLSTGLRNVHGRLDDFDFPSLFAGVASSTTSSDSKIVRFKAWKSGFSSMRRYVMGTYKQRYGAWPPKAKSKKNNFEESGLNRLLLRQVYQDFCDLYDVLVDRTSFTTRHVEIPSGDEPDDPHEPLPRALRRVLSEYDRSTPPVQPPIPFDTPLLPSLSSTRRGFDALDPRKKKRERMKKLKDNEINTALMQSYNRDLMKSTPFLQAFFAYERSSAHGKTIEEITDLRVGQWIFLYSVIQSLPLLVVDAPGLRYTEGVQYFLSEFSKESPPWMRQDQRQKTTWRIPGSDTMVDLPAASVEHSNDAIYQRSHCWQIAQAWAGPAAVAGVDSQYDVPYEELLPPVMPSNPGSRSQSPDRRLSSMPMGLEQLPMPFGVGGSPRGSRPTSTYDPTKSFDAILGLRDGQDKKEKEKKK